MPAPTTAPPTIVFDPLSGRVLHAGGGVQTLMLPWPVMRAFRRALSGGEWRRCRPQFALLPEAGSQQDVAEAHVAGCAEEREPAECPLEGLEQIRLYCASIPAPVQAAVLPFPERHWDLLAWCARTGPAADDLLHSNPALAFAIATAPELAQGERPAGYADTQFLLAYWRQRDVLRRLGFPATSRARRILQKMLPDAVSVRHLKTLRQALADEQVAKRLVHLPRINGAVQAMLENGTIAQVTQPALIRVALQEEGRVAESARRLSDALRVWRMAPARPPGVGEEREQARTGAAAPRTRRTSRVSSSPFPPPPIPGTDFIVPITSREMLAEEGRIQANCVGSYGTRITKRQVAIYRVLSPQRCTLSIVPSGRRWVIGQLKTRANGKASTATYQTVHHWLTTMQPTINVDRDGFDWSVSGEDHL